MESYWRSRRRWLHEGEFLSERYREYREYREDYEENEAQSKEQPENYEQIEQRKHEHEMDFEWKQRCKEGLDRVEHKDKRDTIPDDWEERCRKGLDRVEERVRSMEKEKNEISDPHDEIDFSDWKERCEHGFDRVEAALKKYESEGPDKDGIDEAREKLHDEFVDDMEKKLDEGENKAKADEVIEYSSDDKSTSSHPDTKETTTSESRAETVSSLVVERPDEESLETEQEKTKPDTEKSEDKEITEIDEKRPESPSIDNDVKEGSEPQQDEDASETKEQESESTKEESNERELEQQKPEHQSEPSRSRYSTEGTDYLDDEEQNREPISRFYEEYDNRPQKHELTEHDRVNQEWSKASEQVDAHLTNPSNHEFQNPESVESAYPRNLEREVNQEQFGIDSSQFPKSNPTHEKVEATSSKGEAVEEPTSYEDTSEGVEEKRESNDKTLSSKEIEDIDTSLERARHKVKMYEPEVRGVKIESTNHLREVIARDFPGFEEHRDFENLMSQAELHDQMSERFGNLESIPSGVVRKFAKEIGAAEKTSRDWVFKEIAPRIYPLLDEAFSKDEGMEKATEIREKLNGIDCIEKLDERLNHPYHEQHTKALPSYEFKYETAKKFYEFLDALENGGTVGDIARRLDMNQSTAQRYFERIPDLVQRAIKETPEYEVKEKTDEVRIDSIEDFRRIQSRHPFVEEFPDYKKLEHDAEVYVTIKRLQREGMLPECTQKELAEMYDVNKRQVQFWLADKKEQELIRRLQIYEKARVEHESRLSPEALEQRIDPSLVYDEFKYLKEVKEPAVEDLVKPLEKLIRKAKSESTITWAELHPYHSGGPNWLRDVAKHIETNRSEIEEALNRQMGFNENPNTRLRVGVVDDHLYVRFYDSSERNWMRIYKNETFHFKSLEAKKQLLEDARVGLDIHGNPTLSKLIGQMADTNYESERQNYDLISDHKYLRGETLYFVLDVTQRKIQDIQDMIDHVGRIRNGRGSIRNPKFPEDAEEVDKMFARFFGSGLSDGHIEKSNRGFVYSESNRDRVEIVKQQAQDFGKVYYHETIEPSGVIRIRFTSVFGRALERRGMPVGDKMFSGKGLPGFLENGTPAVICEYYKQMWVQDGNFYVEPSGKARFQWDRGSLLADPSKADKYNYESKVDIEHIDLVCRFTEAEETEELGKVRKLTLGDLRNLTKSKDSMTSATACNLLDIAKQNPPKLMEDEIELLRSIGVNTNKYLAYLIYYEKSGRLSTLWHASTATQGDAMKGCLMCPPEDVKKKSKVEAWMKGQTELKQKIREQVAMEGVKSE